MNKAIDWRNDGLISSGKNVAEEPLFKTGYQKLSGEFTGLVSDDQGAD
jgi:hypothetical protein